MGAKPRPSQGRGRERGRGGSSGHGEGGSAFCRPHVCFEVVCTAQDYLFCPAHEGEFFP